MVLIELLRCTRCTLETPGNQGGPSQGGCSDAVPDGYYRSCGLGRLEGWNTTIMNSRSKKLSTALVFAGVLLSAAGASAATTPPSPATGKFTTQACTTDSSGFCGAYAGKVDANSALDDFISPILQVGTSSNMFTFCVEPNAVFNTHSATGYDLVASATSGANDVLKAGGLAEAKSVWYLLEHLTYYGDATAAFATGGNVVKGTMSKKADPTDVIGTPISTVPTGQFAIDNEYAAFQLAIKKHIKSDSIDFATITDATIKARAQELYDAAVGKAPSAGFGSGAIGVEINATSATAETSATLNATFDALMADGSTSVVKSQDVTITSSDATLDLDPTTPALDASLVAKVDAEGKLTDATGKVGVTIAKPAADATITITLANAIAPGTLMNTTEITSGVKGQQLVTTDWAGVAKTLTVTSAVTPAAPSTTAKPTKLPMSGPVTSLPLLLGGAFLGAAGLWLRRRPI
jgi:hypothetical protein